MTPHRAFALALSATLLLAGCGDDDASDLDELRAELEARDAAEDELAERVADLERELAGGDDAELAEAGDLDELTERVEELAGRLGDVDDAVGSERDTRQEVAAELEATAGDLRSTLTDVQGELEALRGELEDLRVRYEILQERVDESSR
jgi:chromosome segregation ATPase